MFVPVPGNDTFNHCDGGAMRIMLFWAFALFVFMGSTDALAQGRRDRPVDKCTDEIREKQALGMECTVGPARYQNTRFGILIKVCNYTCKPARNPQVSTTPAWMPPPAPTPFARQAYDQQLVDARADDDMAWRKVQEREAADAAELARLRSELAAAQARASAARASPPRAPAASAPTSGPIPEADRVQAARLWREQCAPHMDKPLPPGWEMRESAVLLLRGMGVAVSDRVLDCRALKAISEGRRP